MIKNAKINYLKKYKYAFGALLVFLFCFLILYNYSRKKDIYILYDNFEDCQNVREYEKLMYYGMCYKNDEIFFKKDKNEKEYEINDIKKFKLISKDEFFKIDFNKFKDMNLILIIKKDKGYEIINVKPIKIIS
ncbi:MAG: hypothetical protein ACOH2D_06235 [Gelidibacter sp.]